MIKLLRDIWDYMSGKKTACAAVVNAMLPWAISQGYVTAETAGMIAAVLVAIGLGHKGVKVAMNTGDGQ